MAFVGIGKGDGDAEALYLVDKILGLRIFDDEQGKMNRALDEVDGGLLIVSQFTLYGDAAPRTPSGFRWRDAARGSRALYDRLVALARRHPGVATGRFRADMRVLVDNDGPVTLSMDTASAGRADLET